MGTRGKAFSKYCGVAKLVAVVSPSVGPATLLAVGQGLLLLVQRLTGQSVR